MCKHPLPAFGCLRSFTMGVAYRRWSDRIQHVTQSFNDGEVDRPVVGFADVRADRQMEMVLGHG